MADFEKALAKTLKHEGGYSDNKKDPGGATNKGISLRFAMANHAAISKVIDIDKDGNGTLNDYDIKSLSDDDIKIIYKKFFWNKWLNKVTSQEVGYEIFDLSVNAGGYRAVKTTQLALNLINSDKIAVDGLMGKDTMTSINKAHPKVLIKAMILFRAKFYIDITMKNPDLLEFIRGWLIRTTAK